MGRPEKTNTLAAFKKSVLVYPLVQIRFLAFLFDVSILIPFFSLLFAPFQKNALIYYLVGQPGAFLDFLLLAYLVCSFSYFLYLVICYTLLGRTIGQKMFSLYLFNTKKVGIKFHQIIFRSFLSTIYTCLLFGIPYFSLVWSRKNQSSVDIFSGSQIYTDNSLFSFKKASLFERSIFCVVQLLCFLIVCSLYGTFFNEKSTILESNKNFYSCVEDKIPNYVVPKSEVLDVALMFYAHSYIDDKCLKNVTSHHLWNYLKPRETYLSMAILSEPGTPEASYYINKNCGKINNQGPNKCRLSWKSLEYSVSNETEIESLLKLKSFASELSISPYLIKFWGLLAKQFYNLGDINSSLSLANKYHKLGHKDPEFLQIILLSKRKLGIEKLFAEYFEIENANSVNLRNPSSLNINKKDEDSNKVIDQLSKDFENYFIKEKKLKNGVNK